MTVLGNRPDARTARACIKGRGPLLRSGEEQSNAYLPCEPENCGRCEVRLSDGKVFSMRVGDVEGAWKKFARSIELKGENFLPVSGINRP